MKFRILLFIIIFITLLSSFYQCVKEQKPLPTSEFSYTTTDECSLPITVSFNNLSQDADVYRWDFGDGTPVLHQENPIHIYTQEGIYTVTLTAYGEGGTDETKEVIYAVSTPVASFTANDTIVSIGDSICFNSSINSTLPSTFLWSFGDGYTSQLQNPCHAYSFPGTYTVVLTVTNACGSTYVIMSNYIVVSQAGASPVPDFIASQTTINTGNAIGFTDLSINNPQSWEWIFSGGTPGTSTLQHPLNIVYNTPGVYNVSLKVSNPFGDSTLVKTSYINVVPLGSAPVTNFVASSTNIAAGNSINFTDLTLNSPTSWQWQFQGGTPNTSTAQNPSNIVYTQPGTYNVSLTTYNSFGNNLHTKQAYITVNPQFISQAQIKKITIENMPFPTSAPYFRNPYYRITTPTNVILRDGRNEYISGIMPSEMPVFWNLTPYFTVNFLNTQYKVRVFDWRSNSSMDIFVGEVVFNLANYTQPPTPFPPSITLQQNGVKVILDIEWQ
ncbi:MAG: PKD domain-containing protein [Bacteroidales bacterium]|nr:PKD domain-containing protein [Bacteroidales bacterium]